MSLKPNHQQFDSANFRYPVCWYNEFVIPSSSLKDKKRNLNMSIKRFAGKVAIVTGSSKG